jgi:hypothetical protein
VTPRIGGDVRDAQGLTLPNDQPKEAAAVRQLTDSTPTSLTDATGHKALEPPVPTDDAQGGVLGIGQVAHPIDNELEDVFQVQDAGDAPHRGVKGVQLLSGPVGGGSGS